MKIPAKTTAVPMTFLHEGRQYIVFAIGADANTSLVALTLPKPGAAGTGWRVRRVASAARARR